LEGSGLIMLAPVLEAIGLGHSADLGRVGNLALSFLRSWHVAPTLPWMLAAFVAVMSVQSCLRAYSSVINSRLETSFTCFLRERLYRAMIMADWLFFTRQRSSDVTQSLMEELQRVGYGTQQMLALLSLVGVAAVQIAIAFSLSPLLTMLALGCGA